MISSNSRSFDRRTFLGGVAAASGMLPFSNWVASVALAGGASTVRERPEASTAKGQQMLAVYRKAVGLMNDKAKFPQHHPHSWRFQSNIHNYPSDEPVSAIFTPAPGENAQLVAERRKLALGPDGTGSGGLWATCPHHLSDVQFLPWHRLYLTYFEQIIEKVAGVPFALPYWDYFDPNRRHMPDMFRDATIGGQTNWLFYKDRSSRFVSDGLSENSIVTLQSTPRANLMKTPNFFTNVHRAGFSDALEEDLHDQIHGAIGTKIGNKVVGMATIRFAARDPIFWLHHASIDRLWESWRNPGPDGKSPRDPNAANSWYASKYAFIDGAAAAQRDKGAAFVLVAAANLKYRYDELYPAPGIVVAAGADTPSGPPTRIQSGEAAGQKLINEGDSVSIPLKPAVNEGVALGFSNNPASRYSLLIKLRTAPEPGVYQVYMDVPGVAGGPATQALVGSFSLFRVGAHSEHGEAHGPTDETVAIDVTAKVNEKVIDPLKPGKVTVRASYLDAPVDITVNSAEIVAK
jgi:tyrosinase